MPFIVEDGNGISTATSYVSTAAADQLLSFHVEVDTWSALATAEKESALQKATEYLDLKFRWYARTLNDTQALQWPRSKWYDEKGVLKTAGSMPKALKKAAAYLAVLAVKELSLMTEFTGTGAIKQYFTDGLNIIFDPKTTESAQILGKRIVEIEMLLKNLGELKNQEYLEESRKTEVRI